MGPGASPERSRLGYPRAVLEPLVEGIWTEATPHRFLGLDMGTRMTVVRLGSGGLLLYSAIAATEERKAAVAELGPVRVVACPNRFHHSFAGEWIEAAPDAELWAPPGLAEKRPDLRIDHVFGKDEPAWANDCEPIPLLGMPPLQENVLWHGATRTLIAADLFQNYARPPGGLWNRIYFKLAGMTNGPAVSRMLRVGYGDREAARGSIDRLIALDPARIVLCHGRIVTEQPAQALRDAFTWLKA